MCDEGQKNVENLGNRANSPKCAAEPETVAKESYKLTKVTEKSADKEETMGESLLLLWWFHNPPPPASGCETVITLTLI